MRRLLVVWCVALLGASAQSAAAGVIVKRHSSPALAQGASPVILVWGDSLSSAYGLPIESGWVRLLQERLRTQGYPHQVVNGSVTGETTAGGLSRLAAALDRHHPQLVLIELGGNDGLRGLKLSQLRANLRAMVRRCRFAGARVLLFEMRMPPNYGADYTDGFQKAFADVARAEGATLVPFFLAAIVDDPAGFQEDGIHPSIHSQPVMLDAVWPVLHPLLASGAAPGATSPP
jgi:acyl-CoA thioesterase-1